MVGTWVQGTLRGIGVAVLAPIVLLLAATAVAAGGGFGSIGSIGQVASGPELPNPNTELAGEPDLKNSQVVGVEQDLLASSARPPGSATSGPRGGARPGSAVPGGGTNSGGGPTSSGGGPVAGGPLASSPTVSSPSSTGSGSSTSSPPTPVNNLLEQTRGLGNQVVPQPLQPLTNNVIDTVGGLGR